MCEADATGRRKGQAAKDRTKDDAAAQCNEQDNERRVRVMVMQQRRPGRTGTRGGAG